MATIKLFHKLAALFLISALFSVALFGSISYLIFKNELVEARTIEATSLASFASQELQNPLYFLNYDELNEIIEKIKENPNVESAYALKADGSVITDGTDENTYFGQTLEDDFVKKSINSHEILVEVEGDILRVSAPVIITEKIGILLIDFSLHELNLVLANLIATLGTLFVIISVIFAGTSFLFSRSILKPVEEVRDAAVEIAEGDLDQKIESTSGDEIGTLASVFNEMSSKLKESYTSLEQKVQERTDELEKANLDLEFEVEVRRSTFELKNAFERLKSLDILKRDIIANVSHELRTPITIVKGALEILGQEENPKMRKKLINTARDALKRQDMIVHDLIEAARMQEAISSKESTLTEIDIERLINLTIIESKAVAHNRDIELISKIDKNLPKIMANHNSLNHVFRNLLNNAIKFTEKGKITLKAKHKNKEVEFCVEDTGIGIEEEFYESIFHPLFQIDSSITRRYSGTGMGLPIVKNIIEEHGGRIWVESTPGSGSKFYFTLPIKRRG
jgi:signal transduction histidine kinase